MKSISSKETGDAAFRPLWWLPGPHLQTVWRTVSPRGPNAAPRRERFETPDGDELWLDRVDGRPDAPLLVLLHGLEGSSFSRYVQGFLNAARSRGWSAVALNFRCCARVPEDPARWIPNLRPRLYHSGETSDFGHLVSRLSAERAGAPMFAAGVSLGGNVLLKWLGENPAQTAVAAAVAISVPFDLAAGGRYMERGLGPRYVGHLLKTLRRKAASAAARFPEAAAVLDLPAIARARSFYEFDDAGTAPLHGFAGAADYYAKSSSLGFVNRIRTPALAISAADDPFLPPGVLDEVRERKSTEVELVTTPRGGHAGFVSGRGRPRYWAEEKAMGWFERIARGGISRGGIS